MCAGLEAHAVGAAAAVDRQSTAHRGLETTDRFPQAPTELLDVSLVQNEDRDQSEELAPVNATNDTQRPT
jgi:hypothetical protein